MKELKIKHLFTIVYLLLTYTCLLFADVMSKLELKLVRIAIKFESFNIYFLSFAIKRRNSARWI